MHEAVDEISHRPFTSTTKESANARKGSRTDPFDRIDAHRAQYRRAVLPIGEARLSTASASSGLRGANRNDLPSGPAAMKTARDEPVQGVDEVLGAEAERVAERHRHRILHRDGRRR